MFREKTRKLLMIDDDPVFSRFLMRKAASQGLDMDHCSSLIDAIYHDRLENYDAAIVDCVLPGVDGFEIAQYFARFLPEIPVVLVSCSERSWKRYLTDPRSAQTFIAKNRGADEILKTTLDVAGRTYEFVD